ncbi:MAG TPA: ABC transporter ATP-binding protein [Euzebyales bacterium]|nr:ABC transporter ATP-binding protein [Euzebyales bacterium]
MSAALVEVDGLHKAYREGGVTTPVLTGASFTLGRGEAVGLVGSSGAGKSTLLSILAGLLLPDAGMVRFDGQDMTTMDEVERSVLRARRIGVVLQRDNLIPFLTAAENVELAIEFAGGDQARPHARQLLDELGLADRVDYLPRRLSGGEAQRAALAVALVNGPDLLLADEVAAELDSGTATRVLELILAASRDRGLTVLLVTHSPALAALAERRLHVVDGQVVEQ